MIGKYLAATAVSVIALQASAESAFSEFVVFGDSLLDPGNIASDMRFTNRVGDGAGDYSVGDYAEISSQLLSDRLSLAAQPAVTGGSNYAVGSYTTAQIANSVSGTGIVTGLGSRKAYLTDNASIGADTLVFIDGGGNDFLQGLITGPADIPVAAQRLVGAISALDAAGAQYIMLSNLPDLGLTATGQFSELLPPDLQQPFLRVPRDITML